MVPVCAGAGKPPALSRPPPPRALWRCQNGSVFFWSLVVHEMYAYARCVSGSGVFVGCLFICK